MNGVSVIKIQQVHTGHRGVVKLGQLSLTSKITRKLVFVFSLKTDQNCRFALLVELCSRCVKYPSNKQTSEFSSSFPFSSKPWGL